MSCSWDCTQPRWRTTSTALMKRGASSPCAWARPGTVGFTSSAWPRPPTRCRRAADVGRGGSGGLERGVEGDVDTREGLADGATGLGGLRRLDEPGLVDAVDLTAY